VEGGDPIVVLLARLGRQGPPDLALDAGVEAYAPLLQIGNLYVPSDAIVEPPLRRDRLRELLAPATERITWLAPGKTTGTFHPESIPDNTFTPLADWVDYLVHSAQAQLAPWVRAATFDFAAFESTGGEWADGPPEDKDREKKERAPKKEKKPTRERAEAEAPVEEEEETPTTRRRRNSGAQAVVKPLVASVEEPEVNADEEALGEVERSFVELDAPADDPQRMELWVKMAELNGALTRRREAGLCWTRVVWEMGGAEEKTAAARWAQSEGRGVAKDKDAVVGKLLAMKEPAREDVRALAANVVAGTAAITADPHKAQLWLDDHDDGLDVRSLWLARLALAKLAGGDPLGLARTRDRILARLARGLSVERDVPTFLRFSSGASTDGGGRGAGAAVRLASDLEELAARFEKTRRQRSAVEAPVEQTKAYVSLVLAYGFARLGQGDRARALREAAMAALDGKDPVHGFLSRAYGVRVDHALEGLPAETPLPAEIAGELNGLEKFLRYKVDRLRQWSTVLEPQERLDPVLAFQKNTKDLRGEEFAAMRAIADPTQLASEAEKLFKKAVKKGTAAEERARLFDGLMDFFPLLPEAQAIPMLEELVGQVEDVEPPRRAALLEEALTVAGHFGRSEMVKQLVSGLEELLAGLGAKHAAEVGRVLGACLRSLRRVGLRDEAAALLEAMTNVTSGHGTPALVARLQLAGGLAYMGRMDRAEPVFSEAHTALGASGLVMPDRLQITRALATALGHAPMEYAMAALAKLAQQLPQITDSFNTNSHFCLSVVHFMESLVLGYASEELALGELGRRWLDEDEYLVRRRIHKDLAEGGSEAPTTLSGKRKKKDK
jgi:hypothetical protein